jgi:arsenite oxidase small subunit
MDRRSFIKICSAVAVTGTVSPCFIRHSQAAELMTYARVKLVDAQGQAIKAGTLNTADAYIFNYPYVSTPCFLINLGKSASNTKLIASDGVEYEWRGGVGSNKSIVSYNAICSHQLAYTGKEVSLISYNAQKSEIAGRAGVITCCAHHSVFDPAQGAKVIFGAAPAPLSSIALEHDPVTDELYATGAYGGLLFDDFFKAYKIQLNEEFGRGKAKELVTNTAQVIPFADYTKMGIQC